MFVCVNVYICYRTPCLQGCPAGKRVAVVEGCLHAFCLDCILQWAAYSAPGHVARAAGGAPGACAARWGPAPAPRAAREGCAPAHAVVTPFRKGDLDGMSFKTRVAMHEGCMQICHGEVCRLF